MGYSLNWSIQGIQYQEHRLSQQACLNTIRHIQRTTPVDHFGIYSPDDRLTACMPQLINLIEPKTWMHLGKGLGAWCYSTSRMFNLDELSHSGIPLYDLDKALRQLGLPGTAQMEILRRHAWTDLATGRRFSAQTRENTAIAA